MNFVGPLRSVIAGFYCTSFYSLHYIIIIDTSVIVLLMFFLLYFALFCPSLILLLLLLLLSGCLSSLVVLLWFGFWWVLYSFYSFNSRSSTVKQIDSLPVDIERSLALIWWNVCSFQNAKISQTALNSTLHPHESLVSAMNESWFVSTTDIDEGWNGLRWMH